MNIIISRVATTSAVLLIAICVGTLVGYGIGFVVTLNLTQTFLFTYAKEHAIDFERPADEAHELLIEMNSSPHAPCSEEELSSFRRLMLSSHFIKDLGRMQQGRLACSATISRKDLPQNQYEPSFPGASGTLVYLKIETLRVGSLTPMVISMGDFYAAIDPYNRNVMPAGVQFTLSSTVSVSSKSPYMGGSHIDLPANVLTKPSSGRIQEILYATQCSTRYATCLTLYLPLGLVVAEQHRQLQICEVAGSILGGCFGVMGVMLYRRKKGIEQQLRRAIRCGSLRVVYQPLVDLSTRKVTGAEALVRWTDEDQLAISPDVFIKIAEERGFVKQITKLVVCRVLLDFGTYLTEHPEFCVNVNIASSDLTDPSFQPMVSTALREAGVLPRSLGIEVTERSMANHQKAIEAIAQLRDIGHEVYIDDFGTGYSSLAYLKDLSVNGIKIDRAFTRAIGTESVTVGILPQIVSMAEALKLQVVAEGIETEAQHSYYSDLAFPLTGQGWLYGHPLSSEEFLERWVEEHPASSRKQQNAKGPSQIQSGKPMKFSIVTCARDWHRRIFRSRKAAKQQFTGAENAIRPGSLLKEEKPL